MHLPHVALPTNRDSRTSTRRPTSCRILGSDVPTANLADGYCDFGTGLSACRCCRSPTERGRECPTSCYLTAFTSCRATAWLRVVSDRISLLVTVKAYPAISQKYGEVVCVAGIRTDTPA